MEDLRADILENFNEWLDIAFLYKDCIGIKEQAKISFELKLDKLIEQCKGSTPQQD